MHRRLTSVILSLQKLLSHGMAELLRIFSKKDKTSSQHHSFHLNKILDPPKEKIVLLTNVLWLQVFKKVGLRKIGPGTVTQAEAAAAAAEYGLGFDPSSPLSLGQVFHSTSFFFVILCYSLLFCFLLYNFLALCWIFESVMFFHVTSMFYFEEDLSSFFDDKESSLNSTKYLGFESFFLS